MRSRFQRLRFVPFRLQTFRLSVFRLQTFRLSMAAFVLAVALIARLPTSHCHCHDTNSSAQPGSDCPFGQLRVLAGSLTLAAPPLAPQILISEIYSFIQIPRQLILSGSLVTGWHSRSPPSLR